MRRKDDGLIQAEKRFYSEKKSAKQDSRGEGFPGIPVEVMKLAHADVSYVF